MLPGWDRLVVIFLLVAALLLWALQQRFVIRLLAKAQVQIPVDSPLGIALETVCGEFGIKPKRILLIPSTIANAGVLDDGSILLTTGLKELLTERQLTAIMAHELSHAKDGDAKRLSRRMDTLTGIVASIIGFLIPAFVVGLIDPLPSDLIWLVLAFVAFTPPFALGLYTAFSRRLEFKCDRVAAEHGYGPALAEALDILHRYQMMPSVWSKALGWRLTHPSLRDRLAAIAQHELKR